MSSTTIVVPCYNEERRLNLDAFRAYVAEGHEDRFLFVNDGSKDGTLAVLEGLAAEDPQRYAVLDVQPNGGKAEAVRKGMLQAFAEAPTYAGYWDADLATPLHAIPRFREQLTGGVEMVFGSRVRLLGRSIERQALRHYLGRFGATMASLVLGIPIYDTQCGAKLFRVDAETRALFADPFIAGWMFDVEILARFIKGRGGEGVTDAIYELPLTEWHDVAGSKVKPSDFPKAFFELASIYLKYRT